MNLSHVFGGIGFLFAGSCFSFLWFGEYGGALIAFAATVFFMSFLIEGFWRTVAQSAGPSLYSFGRFLAECWEALKPGLSSLFSKVGSVCETLATKTGEKFVATPSLFIAVTTGLFSLGLVTWSIMMHDVATLKLAGIFAAVSVISLIIHFEKAGPLWNWFTDVAVPFLWKERSIVGCIVSFSGLVWALAVEQNTSLAVFWGVIFAICLIFALNKQAAVAGWLWDVTTWEKGAQKALMFWGVLIFLIGYYNNSIGDKNLGELLATLGLFILLVGVCWPGIVGAYKHFTK